MKTILACLVISISIVACKKDDDVPEIKARLLDYKNDQPIADATVSIYHNTGPVGSPEKVVTTDENGYFFYPAYDNVCVVPEKLDWWNPLPGGFPLRLSYETLLHTTNDSLIYLFHPRYTVINLYYDSSLYFPSYTFSISARFPKIFGENSNLRLQFFDGLSYPGQSNFGLLLVDSVANNLRLSGWFPGTAQDEFFVLADTTFIPTATSNNFFEFYY